MVKLQSIVSYIRKYTKTMKTKQFDELKNPIWLYLGAGTLHRKNYTGVDVFPVHGNVVHNCLEPFPMQDGSVERIFSEDMIEHLPADKIVALLNECFRILKKDGLMIIGVPDYNNPKDKHCIEIGNDPRYPEHITLTTYELMKSFIEQSNFQEFEFHHYWENGYFHMKPFDYSLGFIRRTPDNDSRNKKGNVLQVTSLVITLMK